MPRFATVLGVVLVELMIGAPTGVAAGGAGRVENPVVTPAAGGFGQASGGVRHDVSEFGYQEKEYLFEGTAKTYPPLDLPPARYRSRMIVWTPKDAARFNGTTVVEWAEVSDFGQFELTVALNAQAPMLEEDGYAFVLVSAEEGGVCDLTASGCTDSSLKGADPERYGSLDHPGDAYSFDIFSQALRAIKHPTGVSPLGDLETRFVIAEGFQRSIDKYFPTGAPVPQPAPAPFGIYGPLNDYLANGADDDARLADAFLIDAAAPGVEPRYRVPVLHHLDESAIRREPTPDRRNHVTWEITGAPHSDRWSGGHIDIPSPAAPGPKLTREQEEVRRDHFDDFGQAPTENSEVCAPGPSTGTPFPRRFTLNAALKAVDRWLRTGERAPHAPRIERPGPVPASANAKLRRDGDGNAIGGLRLPIIDVPVATYNGEACISSGTMTPFSPVRLAALYPTHETYVRKLLEATDGAVAKRFLVCQDAETIMRKASASTIGGTDTFTASPRCGEGSQR